MSSSVVLDATAARRARPKNLGPWQAIWLIAGFVALRFVLEAVAGGVDGFVQGFEHGLHHVAAPIALSPRFLSLASIGSYWVAGLWSYRFVRRRAALRLHDGSVSGVGLCPASWLGYAAAVLLAAVLLGVVALLYRLFTPAQVQDVLFARALSGSGDAHHLLLVLILVTLLVGAPVQGRVVGAPVWGRRFKEELWGRRFKEEFIFRGAAFAGIAARWGTLAAVAATTVLFVALHISEKMHYLPGFLDVALLAVANSWLRLRFRSIHPAMLCHAIYNVGVIAIAALMFSSRA